MSVKEKPIVVVGSINMDLVASASHIPNAGETVLGGEFQTYHGGKGANQAVAAARLGYPVRMVGRVGNDVFGQQLRLGLETAGVDITGVSVTEGPSGVALIVVSPAGENSIVVAPGANSHVSSSDLDASVEIIRSAGIVLAQLEIPIESILHLATICTRESVPLMLDPAPAKELPPEFLHQVTWFTPNETEAAFFTGSEDGDDVAATAENLMNKGVHGVVLKLGSRGAYVAGPSGAAESVQPFTVRAVDTTAAGDCFNGAFAVALLRGKGWAESARFAAAAAAISVTRVGAQPSMPTLPEVDELVLKRS